MLDALLWYTGLVFWLSVVVAVACFVATEANDRMVKRRLLEELRQSGPPPAGWSRSG